MAMQTLSMVATATSEIEQVLFLLPPLYPYVINGIFSVDSNNHGVTYPFLNLPAETEGAPVEMVSAACKGPVYYCCCSCLFQPRIDVSFTRHCTNTVVNGPCHEELTI